jgi:type II secretory pathway component GspD/PulD (secretin)
MRVKRIVISTIVIAAAVIYAQDVAEIFTELKTKTGPGALPVAPAQEQTVGITVSKPLVLEKQIDAVVVPVASAPVKVEPVPAVVEVARQIPAEPSVNIAPVAAPSVTPEADIQNVAVVADQTPGTVKGGLISLSLKEVELNSVIRLFATLSDANIIVPTLEGTTGAVKVDVNLKNVEWKPALQSILDAHSLELYEKSPGAQVYSVRKKPADAPLARNIKIFKLDYASVSNVNEMIQTMVPKEGPTAGKISVFPARNTIVVQSTPENLLDIQAMITAVDLPRQQVFIEAKIMELTDSASKQLGIDWAMLGGDEGGYGVGLTKIGGTYNNNSTVTEKRFTDIAGRRYEDVTPLVADFPARPGSGGLDDTRTTGVTPTISDNSTVTKTMGATLSASDFELVLAALKAIKGIKIVSNPKVIVANEETAKIYIGRKEPNIKQDTTQAQQADAVTTYNLDPARPFFEYGIKLDVTPVINTASNITVAIEPSISRFYANKTIQGGGALNSFPITDEKSIKTVFALESGQTAAIGGLSELDSSDVERKIPVLGSIPLVGRLFSYSSTKNEQRENVIFVTVGLANPAHINMETGLPQDSSLAMRYDAKNQADKQIKLEEQKMLKQHEAERADEAVKKLRDTEQKRLDKKQK